MIVDQQGRPIEIDLQAAVRALTLFA